MSYLRHIHTCNFNRPEEFLDFIVNGIPIGKVKHTFAQKLKNIPHNFRQDDNALYWEPAANDFDSLNQAMSNLTDNLLSSGILPYRQGELYPVTNGQREQALFLMDRALVPYFGVHAFGQHMNGYVRRDGEIYMWIAKRAQDRRIDPGKLDNLVAGGLPWGISLEENLAKECWEEAAIPEDLASQAVPVGHIAYVCQIDKGLKPDKMYCYDLELPQDFIPRCTDGEVETFYLWPLEKVAQRVHDSNDFKKNCNLVIIDFLIRHGYINQDDQEYVELVNGLR